MMFATPLKISSQSAFAVRFSFVVSTLILIKAEDVECYSFFFFVTFILRIRVELCSIWILYWQIIIAQSNTSMMSLKK